MLFNQKDNPARDTTKDFGKNKTFQKDFLPRDPQSLNRGQEIACPINADSAFQPDENSLILLIY